MADLLDEVIREKYRKYFSSDPLKFMKEAIDRSAFPPLIDDLYHNDTDKEPRIPLREFIPFRCYGSFHLSQAHRRDAQEHRDGQGKAITSFLKTFLSKSRYIAIDLTGVISLSEGVISAMLGHDSNESNLPIVQLLLLFNMEEKEMSYYRILSGSITSVMSISSTMEESGISNVVLIGDTGFYSPGNVENLEEKGIHYILPLKSNSPLISYDIEMKRYFLYEDRPVWYTHVPGERNIYIFRDTSLKAEEEKDFLRREEGKRRVVSRFRSIENRMGKIAVMTDLKVSGEVIYDMLKTRADIEQAYDTLNNTIHADRTYVRDDYQMQGWMFVNFIVLMLLPRI